MAYAEHRVRQLSRFWQEWGKARNLGRRGEALFSCLLAACGVALCRDTSKREAPRGWGLHKNK